MKLINQKTPWQEWQCWEYQCDKVCGDSGCDNLLDGHLCEYQKELQKHNKQMDLPKLDSPLAKAFLRAKEICEKRKPQIVKNNPIND